MIVATALVLSLLSAVALNWGWVVQHGAASGLPALSLRAPLRSLRSLFGDLSWVTGFVVGLAGWALYIGALTLAPLSLVQGVSAGGIALLAAFSHRRGAELSRFQWWAVGIATVGLVLLAVSLAGGAGKPHAVGAVTVVAWLAVLGAVAALAGRVSLGVTAGVLYGAGDIATKGATFGGAWLLLIGAVLAAHGLAFVALQFGFQRGGALATAGTATLLTNALPIVAGIALFHEHLPGGALGATRVIAFVLVVVAAALLAREDAPALRAEPRLGLTERV